MRKELKTAASFLSGAGDIAALIGYIRRTAMGPIERYQKLTSPGAAKTLPTDAKDPAERFRIAATTYGVSDVEIERRIRVTGWCFYLAGFASLALLASGLGSLATGGYLRAETCVCSGFICGLLALRNGFANYQLRSRSLASFRSYLSSENILPASSGSANP